MIARALAATGLDLSRLGGPIGEAARALRPGQRERAEWATQARAPVTPGVRGIHASWIEHALSDLPPRARQALAAGGGDAVDVWLARWACAELVPVPALPEAGELEASLRARGAEEIAIVARGAAGLLRGERVRAAIARCTGTTDRLVIGARAAAPQLGDQAHAIALRLPRAIGLIVRDQLMSSTWRTLCNSADP